MNYQLYICNYSYDINYEIVVMVDGLDVLNGKVGLLNYYGYIVNVGDLLVIKGFCKDKYIEVVFQFVDVVDVYVVYFVQGDVCNIGVIGFVVFVLQGKVINMLLFCFLQVFLVDNNGYVLLFCCK